MQFESEGWALLPRFLDASGLAELAPAVDRVLALQRPSCMQRPGNDLVPLRWNDEIVASVLGAEHLIAAIRDLLRTRQLAWISGYVSTKEPHSPALWWHQDWWCWDHPVSYTRPASQIALLCYLGETDEMSGALRLLPGSHHRSVPLHATLPEAHGGDANALSSAHPALNDDPGQVTVNVRAGDVVIIDYRLLHGTHPNAKPLRRDCILLSFVPDWGRLPDDIKAHLAMHPALPTDAERQRSDASSYGGLLPDYGGTPASLAVNRMAPAAFAAS
ncbi:phytanoyl-CoA dioxygenase family protein [Bradyrhizobium sp. LHD-71]|uniref:phytanoyl-CoA dioxygenase family protein n=1 Tax=Bradyrhizobium sp. LHD-71 TaxID=3072141 RepID=UPI0028105A50|nr:phytanoyl-CoA dioxygenase family protein [Bradyrhizobium sp. LHD-71]MDQ8731743.1 phytanoyl-CoA dioxygenase family protein [Bradyrhizobium sp. LHD-71]